MRHALYLVKAGAVVASTMLAAVRASSNCTAWHALRRCCVLSQARRMLREADENGDGLVSREEFHDLFTRSTTPDVLQGYDSRWSAPEASNGVVAA